MDETEKKLKKVERQLMIIDGLLIAFYALVVTLLIIL